MNIFLLAALCMVGQDTFAVLKYQAVTRNHGVIAGALDNGTWLLSTVGSTIAVFTMHSRDWGSIALLVLFIFAANMIGNWSGTALGRRFIHDADDEQRDNELEHLTQRIAALEANGASPMT